MNNEENKVKKIINDNYELVKELINEFDSSYEKSEVIKSLSKTSNGFGAYSKLLTKEQMDNLYNFVDKKEKGVYEGFHGKNLRLICRTMLVAYKRPN